jgi:hypothetical protein
VPAAAHRELAVRKPNPHRVDFGAVPLDTCYHLSTYLLTCANSKYKRLDRTTALQTLYGSVIQYQIGVLSSGNVLASVRRCLGVTARSLTLR